MDDKFGNIVRLAEAPAERKLTMGKTHAFLRAVLGFDERLDVRAVATPDIGEEHRKGFKGLLRAGMARRLTPGVYAMAHPVAFMAGVRELVPPPFETAAALCRLHGRNMAIPMVVAEFVLGLSGRPRLHDVSGPFPWDGDERLEVAGVVLEPVDPRIPSMSPAGQAVALAGSKVGRENLREAAHGVLASVREWLRGDLPSLTPGEREVAEAILAIPAGAARTAPDGFMPSSEACPTVHGWRIAEFGDREVLTADLVTGHPSLDDDRLGRSSPLIWVDERIGWARTTSRYYRLGVRA